MVTRPDGAEIAAFAYGDTASSETPVLLIHGNGEEHGIFGPVIDAVVTAGRMAVALDARAQGRSTRGTARLSYELLADDALAVLDDLDIARAHVVGFSDGGIEGLILARDHPDRVGSLLAIGANLTPEGVIEEPAWDLVGSISTNRSWGEAHFAAGIDTTLLIPTPREARESAELLQLMLDEPHLSADSLGAIRCPTTVMVGEFDVIADYETVTIFQAIPGARLVVVPDCGHSIPKRDPKSVVRELTALLGGE